MGAGDEIELLSRDENNVTVADIVSLYAPDKVDLELMRRAVAVEALPEKWRDHFGRQLSRGGV